MSHRNPLGQARGLGSAKSGTAHWWAQRVTALALIPLGLWFAVTALQITHADYADVVTWLHQPQTDILMSLFLAALFYHAWLGVQVIIEDYVHVKWLKFTTLLVIKFACILLAVAGIFTVLRIAFGA